MTSTACLLPSRCLLQQALGKQCPSEWKGSLHLYNNAWSKAAQTSKFSGKGAVIMSVVRFGVAQTAFVTVVLVVVVAVVCFESGKLWLC